MPGNRGSRARDARTVAVVEDVHSIDVICIYIASGGTLAEWCRGKDIRFNDINAWLQEQNDRRERYTAALELRDKHQKDRVLHELTVMLDADLREAFTEHGALKSIHDMPDGIRKMIAAIDVEEVYEGSGRDRVKIGELKKIKLWNKEKGIELMARHHKMLTDKTELGGKLTLADLVGGSMPAKEGTT